MITETPADDAATGAASLSDLLDNRHQATPDHESHREVGERQPEPDAAPPSSAQPAQTPETSPATQPAPAAQPAADPDPATDPKAPRWYREHMAKTNREAASLRAENERLRTGGQPATTPAQPRPAPTVTLPNPAEDPQGFYEAIERQNTSRLQQFQLQTTLNLSERFARQQHGGEAFEDCKSWLTTRPDLEAYFLQQPDPWGAAFSHFSREKLAEEIGDDPAAFRARVEKEIREKLEAEIAGRPAAPPAPAPQMRAAPPLPASTARSAAPDRDTSGRFTGARPIKTRHNFG